MLRSLSIRLDHAHLLSSQPKTFHFDGLFTKGKKRKDEKMTKMGLGFSVIATLFLAKLTQESIYKVSMTRAMTVLLSSKDTLTHEKCP